MSHASGIARVLIALLLMLALSSTALPAFAESGRQVYTSAEVEHEPAMWTITKDTFYGGVFGSLIALAGFFISEFEMPPEFIGYCAGGGMILGAGVGVWEVATRDDILDPRASAEAPPYGMEKTWMVGIARFNF